MVTARIRANMERNLAAMRARESATTVTDPVSQQPKSANQPKRESALPPKKPPCEVSTMFSVSSLLYLFTFLASESQRHFMLTTLAILEFYKHILCGGCKVNDF
jgi:hypothetical protein